MSVPQPDNNEPITSKDQLVNYLAAAAKPPADWRIGTEHEKFAFRQDDLRPLPYEGDVSIRSFLERLHDRFGWQRLLEGDKVIGLKGPDGATISLEPGGQIELSGAPLANIHETCDEVQTHLAQTRSVGNELGAGLLGLGFQPKWPRRDIPWMPKQRYRIMGDYMPKRGELGLDMMTRSCTVQVNLDYGSEADMVTKFRLGLALQPVATALFANSPFTEGRPNGYQSYRSHIWEDTDPDRTGDLPFVFDEGFGYEAYVDYALDVPMYLIRRDGHYIDCSGESFRSFLAGKLPQRPGEIPVMGDFAEHLTTIFPEVRLKQYLEMRGADGGPWMRLCALPALWVGLLYDDIARDEAWQLCKGWDRATRAQLRHRVPVHGLRTEVGGRTLREVAMDVVSIAERGLQRRGRATRPDRAGQVRHRDERYFLDSLKEIAATGHSPSDILLARYHGPWGGSVDPVFDEFAY